MRARGLSAAQYGNVKFRAARGLRNVITGVCGSSSRPLCFCFSNHLRLRLFSKTCIDLCAQDEGTCATVEPDHECDGARQNSVEPVQHQRAEVVEVEPEAPRKSHPRSGRDECAWYCQPSSWIDVRSQNVKQFYRCEDEERGQAPLEGSRPYRFDRNERREDVA